MSPRLRVLAFPASGTAENNPYVTLLYDAMQRCGEVDIVPYGTTDLLRHRWDIVHVHWPEWLAAGARGEFRLRRSLTSLATLRLARRRGAALAWTAHDAAPHDATPPLLRHMAAFASQVDLLLGLSRVSVAEVRASYPALQRAAAVVTPHGDYRSSYPDPGMDRDAARARLSIGPDLGGRVMLYFGQIRPYKNVPRLIAAFRHEASEHDRLLVVGELHAGVEAAELEVARQGDHRVLLHHHHVASDEVGLYFRAADIVVLPYTRILNSGAALLALSFDRPVVVPAIGSMPELRDEVGSEWVWTYDGPLTGSTVRRALLGPLPSGRVDLTAFGWDTIAAHTLEAFEAARASKSGPR